MKTASVLQMFIYSSHRCQFIPPLLQMFSECEITIRSGVDNSSGIVTTPGFDKDGVYPPNTKCLFKFIAKKNERVKIDFIKLSFTRYKIHLLYHELLIFLCI